MQATTEPKTLVTLLLDRSYSMHSVHEQTVVAINDWLAELRKSEGNIHFSLVMFDHFEGAMQLEKRHIATPIADVPDLGPADFQPRGGTPLIDAACVTIRAVRESLRGKTARSVIAIQTDGEELNSKAHSWEELRGLIAECEAEGFEFNFMGAGIDAFKQGARMGIAASKTLSYGKNLQETRAAFRETAMNTSLYASGSRADMSYTAEQRTMAGERDLEVAVAADAMKVDVVKADPGAWASRSKPGYSNG